MKKMIALLTLMAMMILPVGGNAEETGKVFDFKDEAVLSALGFTRDTSITFDGTMSAKWNPKNLESSGAVTAESGLIPTDWSQYTHLNILMYSKEASNAKVNVAAVMSDNALNAMIGYIKLDFTGWKKVSLPLRYFLSGRGASWSNTVQKVYFNGSGYADSRFEDFSSITQPLYFDSMWLSTEGEDGGDYVVADFGQSNQITDYSNVLSVDEENTNLYNVSAKWNNPTANGQIMISTPKTVDMTQYTYLKQWIYSETANNQIINVVIYDSNSKYKLYQTNADFEGWKLLSIPVASITEGAGDLSKAVRLDYNISGWDAAALETTSINFDKIWLSNNDEEPEFAFVNLPEQNGKQNVTNTVLKFEMSSDAMETITPANVEVNYSNADGSGRDTEYSVFGYGKNIYVTIDSPKPETEYRIRIFNAVSANGQTASGSQTVTFTTAEKTEEQNEKLYIADFTKDADINKFGLKKSEKFTLRGTSAKWDMPSVYTTTEITADEGVPTDWTEYETFNMLIYAPESNGAKINIVPSTSSGYMLAFMKLDFTGWKKVSIPIRSFHGATDANISSVAKFRMDIVNWALDTSNGYETAESITTPVYIDSIWLEKAHTDEYTLAQYDNFASIVWGTGSKMTVDTGNSKLFTMSGKWDTTAQTEIKSGEFAPTDMSRYSYVNVLAYSAAKTDAKINMVFHNPSSNGKPRYLYNQDFTVDWAGAWKVVSVPLANFARSGNGGSFENVNYFALSSSGWGVTPAANTVLNIDRVWLSNTPGAKDVTVTELPEQNGAELLKVSDNILMFKTSSTVYEYDEPAAFTVYANGEIIPAAEYSGYGNGDRIYLVFNKPLEYGAAYDITMNAVLNGAKDASEGEYTVRFTTEPEQGLAVTEKNISYADGKANVNVTISNRTNTARTPILVRAEYTESGKLVSLTRTECAVEARGTVKISDTAEGSESTTRVFIWNENFSPVGEEIPAQ